MFMLKLRISHKSLRNLAATASLLVLGLGCAAPHSSFLNGGQVAPPVAGQGSNTPLPSSNAVTNALLGTYTGTLYSGTQTQTYEFTISNNQNQPYGKFVSSGALGNLGFEGFLNMGLNGYPYGGLFYYSFVSSIQTWPAVSPTAAAVELILALRASGGTYTVDLAQSTIRLLDCGFSQGGVCSNQVQGAGFNADLGKR